MKNERKKNIQFQNDGADNICSRMDKKKRFLLADEVGLGKTITAANIIAGKMKDSKSQDSKSQNSKSLKVGYICGNEALAKENIRKLKDNVKEADPSIDDVNNRGAERLSLGFTAYLKQTDSTVGNKTLSIYTLTPSTTIRFTSSGNKEERAWVYYLFTACKNIPRDIELEDACTAGLKDTDKFNKVLNKEVAWLSNSPDKDLHQKFINSFYNPFEKIFQDEWDKIKDQCFENCINVFLYHMKDQRSEFFSECITQELLKHDIHVGRRKKHDKKFDSSNATNKLYMEFQKIKITEQEMKIYQAVAEHMPNRKTKDVKRTIAFEYRRKHIADYLECFNELDGLFKQCDQEKTVSYKAFTELRSHACVDKMQQEKVSYSKLKKYKVEEDDNTVLLEHTFIDTCCKEIIRTARKCMAVQSVEMMDMNLFLADEIQNYSEIFRTTDKKKADSEMNLVIDKLIMGDYEIVLMSATPFRYHTKLSELINRDRDDNADSEQFPVSDDANENITDMGTRYIKKDTDIYSEFQNIIRYLRGDDSEDWFQKWEKLNRKKIDIVNGYDNLHNAQAKETAHKEYKECVWQQSQMLKEAGISRVERYMAGCSAAVQSSKNKNNIMLDLNDWDNILARELRCMSENTIAEAEAEQISEGDILFQITDPSADDYEEWYIYSQKNFNLFKANNILNNLTFFGDYDEDDNADEDKGNNKYKICADHDGDPCFAESYKGSIELYKRMRDNRLSVRKDYIKSTPAYLSFKQGYKKLRNIQSDSYMLSKERVKNFEPLFADKSSNGKELLYNARLARLFEVLFDTEELHKLLFIPPSRGDAVLKGVFNKKRGISKRLFFTDYNMTPKSLSVLLSYEAARRTLNDIKSDTDIPVVPGSETVISIKKLKEYGLKEHETEEYDFKEYAFKKRIIDELYEYDIQNSNQEGSPYGYAQTKDFTSEDISTFCKAYFEYMTKMDSLRVLAAYAEGNCLYDKITSYGANGCINKVLDEYFEYIPTEDGKGPAQMFREVLGITLYGVNTRFQGDNEDTKMPVAFAVGHYAGDRISNSAANTLSEKIRLFNSPFRPFQFISTSIGQEGFDFHVYCRKVVHWSLEFDPAKFEQREGRINRYQSYANRLNIYDRYYADRPGYVSFKETFETEGKKNDCELVNHSWGLFPDFTVPDGKFHMIRECYYYPSSFESHNLENVLKAVGYYRALLGQISTDNFEDAFKKFVDDRENVNGETNIEEYFVNLYPKKGSN